MIMEKVRGLHLEVLDLLDDAVFYVSSDRKILSWNKGAERLYGYNDREIIGRPLKILFHPDIRPIDLNNRENTNSVHVTKDNQIKYVNLSIKFSENSYLIICKDRTEQIFANAEVEKSRIQSFNSLYELYHNNLCQLLTGLIFKHKNLESKIEPFIKLNKDLKLQVDDINSILDSSIKHCRIFEKQMNMLCADSENFEDLVDQYLEIIREKYNVSCSVKFCIKNITEIISNFLFFILQRIVAYTVEQNKADRIEITLSNSGIDAVIIIEVCGSKTVDLNDEYLKAVKHWINLVGGSIAISTEEPGLFIIECRLINL